MKAEFQELSPILRSKHNELAYEDFAIACVLAANSRHSLNSSKALQDRKLFEEGIDQESCNSLTHRIRANATTLYLVGVMANVEGDVERAIAIWEDSCKMFRMAWEFKPSDATWPIVSLALVYCQMERPKDARKYLGRYMTICTTPTIQTKMTGSGKCLLADAPLDRKKD